MGTEPSQKYAPNLESRDVGACDPKPRYPGLLKPREEKVTLGFAEVCLSPDTSTSVTVLASPNVWGDANTWQELVYNRSTLPVKQEDGSYLMQETKGAYTVCTSAPDHAVCG